VIDEVVLDIEHNVGVGAGNINSGGDSAGNGVGQHGQEAGLPRDIDAVVLGIFGVAVLDDDVAGAAQISPGVIGTAESNTPQGKIIFPDDPAGFVGVKTTAAEINRNRHPTDDVGSFGFHSDGRITALRRLKGRLALDIRRPIHANHVFGPQGIDKDIILSTDDTFPDGVELKAAKRITSDVFHLIRNSFLAYVSTAVFRRERCRAARKAEYDVTERLAVIVPHPNGDCRGPVLIINDVLQCKSEIVLAGAFRFEFADTATAADAHRRGGIGGFQAEVIAVVNDRMATGAGITRDQLLVIGAAPDEDRVAGGEGESCGFGYGFPSRGGSQSVVAVVTAFTDITVGGQRTANTEQQKEPGHEKFLVFERHHKPPPFKSVANLCFLDYR